MFTLSLYKLPITGPKTRLPPAPAGVSLLRPVARHHRGVLNALQKHDGREEKQAVRGARGLGVRPCEEQNVLLALCYMLAWQQ